MDGRKIFEYGFAGVITGLLVKPVYSAYKDMVGDSHIGKINLRVEDILQAQDFDDEEDEDYYDE